MKIIITGSTGTVGSEVVRQAVADDDIKEIILVARNPSSTMHPKIRQVIHKDFLKYNGLENIFLEADACIWCLGISQTRVTKADYFKITYEYAVAAARAMIAVNPSISFVFLSGQGADSSEKSSVRFAKVKGQTENALQKLNLKKLIILRPGGIYPVSKSTNTSVYKKAELAFIRLMKVIVPSTVINTDVLAKAMLKSIKQHSGQIIINHNEIRLY
ncbi:MAG TPA: NAD(P)H-binding protein [Flavitalea sp.]|nr:NAD(P)H-binding protein [Flavitalea sp.]